MADPKFLPPEPTLPEVPGGRYRPSLLVDVDQYPDLRRRLDLNAQLLQRTCPFGSPDEEPRFGTDVLDLLLRTVGERFGAEAALLRHQAVVALGTVDAREAVERLVELSVNPVEHEGIRIAALAALPREVVEDLVETLSADPSPAVAAFVRELREGPTERPRLPGHVPVDRKAPKSEDDGWHPHADN